MVHFVEAAKLLAFITLCLHRRCFSCIFHLSISRMSLQTLFLNSFNPSFGVLKSLVLQVINVMYVCLLTSVVLKSDCIVDSSIWKFACEMTKPRTTNRCMHKHMHVDS